MGYDFDTPVNRRGTDCLKFDFTRERHHNDDVLSYWIADMDFATAPEITQAIIKRAQSGVFGYTDGKSHYYQSVKSWYKEQFDYDIPQTKMFITPGVVMAIGTAINALTEKGDAVIIQNPVYYPFRETILAAGRRLVTSPLIWKDGRYEIDFDDFEKKIKENNVKLFLLCNPHNPGGTAWKRQELERLGKICLENNVLVFSDEIHSDFIWEPHKHTVFASISKELEKITLTGTSPTKTFNLAGIQVSNIFVADPALHQKYKNGLDAAGYSQPNLFGLTATEAAYTSGRPWLSAVKKYIEENLEKTVSYLNSSSLPFNVKKPEATYLLWIDCAQLGFSDTELNRLITQKANLWLDAGNIFGREGMNFQRINVATAWSYLEQGLERLVSVLKS